MSYWTLETDAPNRARLSFRRDAAMQAARGISRRNPEDPVYIIKHELLEDKPRGQIVYIAGRIDRKEGDTE